jgi:hypothetical protein
VQQENWTAGARGVQQPAGKLEKQAAAGKAGRQAAAAARKHKELKHVVLPTLILIRL